MRDIQREITEDIRKFRNSGKEPKRVTVSTYTFARLQKQRVIDGIPVECDMMMREEWAINDE